MRLLICFSDDGPKRLRIGSNGMQLKRTLLSLLSTFLPPITRLVRYEVISLDQVIFDILNIQLESEAVRTKTIETRGN